jgi:Flp pilus assembly protein TadD
MARDPGRDAARAARAELDLVLQAACAELLEEAALLRSRWSPLGFFTPELLPRLAAVASWRADARRALAILRSAGLAQGDAPALLRRLVATDESTWPRASRLARAALRSHATDRRALALAQALLAEGETRRARRVLTGVITRDPEQDVLWRAYAGLGAAHESDGNDRLACAAFERAGRVQGAGAEPLVGGLFLALALGDFAWARDAGERLDDLAAADPTAGEVLAASLRRLANRTHLRVDAPPRGRAAAFARELIDGARGPSALVARVFLGGDA